MLVACPATKQVSKVSTWLLGKGVRLASPGRTEARRMHRVAGSHASYGCRATFMFSATRPVSMLMAPNSFSMTQIFLPWSCEE